MEAWRQAASEILPMFRQRVDEAEDVGQLWRDLWDCEVEGVSGEPLGEEAVSSLFQYGSWCLLSDDEEAQSAAIINFYEMLPTNVRFRRDLHRYLSVEDFLGLKGLFEYNLPKGEHEDFIQEFLSKAGRRAQGQAGTSGEA